MAAPGRTPSCCARRRWRSRGPPRGWRRPPRRERRKDGRARGGRPACRRGPGGICPSTKPPRTRTSGSLRTVQSLTCGESAAATRPGEPGEGADGARRRPGRLTVEPGRVGVVEERDDRLDPERGEPLDEAAVPAERVDVERSPERLDTAPRDREAEGVRAEGGRQDRRPPRIAPTSRPPGRRRRLASVRPLPTRSSRSGRSPRPGSARRRRRRGAGGPETGREESSSGLNDGTIKAVFDDRPPHRRHDRHRIELDQAARGAPRPGRPRPLRRDSAREGDDPARAGDADDRPPLGGGDGRRGRLRERFAALARAAGAGRITAVATCAVREADNGSASRRWPARPGRDGSRPWPPRRREAENGPEFLRRIRKETGIRAVAISGEEEARLTMRAVRLDLPASCDPLLVVDIGGGSTEVVVASGDALAAGREPRPRSRPADGALRPERRRSRRRTKRSSSGRSGAGSGS